MASVFENDKSKLEPLLDEDMFLMNEKGIRGGLCQTTHRYAVANNKYMKYYDKTKPSTYLHYLDSNNLYGWAMCKKLPIGDFHKDITEDFIKKYDENGDYGYLLEVDVKYCKHLWHLHKDLPFLPQRIKVNKVEKLIAWFSDREKSVVHILALKQALNHGLKLRKVHRAIKFRQEAWLKPYIDLNTNLRKNAKSEFEKNFFKLMNNVVFGKTMENVR